MAHLSRADNSSHPRPLRLAVVGGGWAGLAAAVEATRRGHAVTVFEMAPQLGGRARRVDVDDMALDNGQHILIGAYRETLRLMATVGVDATQAFVRTPLRLATPDGTGLQLPGGSPLIAFTRGVLAQRGWPIRERLALLLAASTWALKGFRCDELTSVATLTANLPAGIREGLVDPLCIAALNTPASNASARVFLRVIRDALFSGAGSADLLLPRWRLTELLPGPAANWLQGAGAELRLSTRVDRIDLTSSGWCVDALPFNGIVLAASAVESARLTASIAPEWSAAAAALQYEPIVTVYARSIGTRLPYPMLALASDETQQPAQFVFDLGQLGGPAGLLAFVISGAAPWLARGVDATRAATMRQAEQLLASHLHSELQPIRVLTEKRATFRCLPALRRPPGRIAPQLHAAGDYVDGPYPATLEGAVRSGIEAAMAVESA